MFSQMEFKQSWQGEEGVRTHLCNFLLDGRTDGRKVAA